MPRSGLALRPAAGTEVVPMDRRYHALSTAQKATLHADHEHIAPGDESPSPADGLEPVVRTLAQGAEHLQPSGTVLVVVEVGANVRAVNAKAFGKAGVDIANYVARVLLATLYKPVVCAGQPCRME